MKRILFAVFAIWFFALIACSSKEKISDKEIAIQVSIENKEIEFGKAFPLKVVRTWSKSLVPEEWSERSLAPLNVQLVRNVRRENDSHVEETLEYNAYAFEREKLVLVPIVFKAKSTDGKLERSASSEELTLTVHSSLPSDSPGAVELPGQPMKEKFPWALWISVGVAALAAILFLVWWIKRRPSKSEEIPQAPPIPAHLRALDRILKLREFQPKTEDEIQAFYVEASSLLREYIEERFELKAPEMTTEEFLSSPQTARALGESNRRVLSEFLAHCDLVKFARHSPTASDRSRILDVATLFVEETKEGRGLSAVQSGAA